MALCYIPEDSFSWSAGETENSIVSFYVNRTLLCDSRLTAQLLSCEEFRDFWVQWDDQLVSIGQGHVPGSRTITWCNVTEHTGQEVKVGAMSVASDREQEGYWQFEDTTNGGKDHTKTIAKP